MEIVAVQSFVWITRENAKVFQFAIICFHIAHKDVKKMSTAGMIVNVTLQLIITSTCLLFTMNWSILSSLKKLLSPICPALCCLKKVNFFYFIFYFLFFIFFIFLLFLLFIFLFFFNFLFFFTQF